MTLTPEAQEFINEQVRAGRYPSAEAVVEAAILEFRNLALDELDDKAISAIKESDAEFDRGEGVELDVFRAEMRQWMADRK
jgi:Arc/MetJ-type ribon-helix-helix transcriptional regulator